MTATVAEERATFAEERTQDVARRTEAAEALARQIATTPGPDYGPVPTVPAEARRQHRDIQSRRAVTVRERNSLATALFVHRRWPAAIVAASADTSPSRLYETQPAGDAPDLPDRFVATVVEVRALTARRDALAAVMNQTGRHAPWRADVDALTAACAEPTPTPIIGVPDDPNDWLTAITAELARQRAIETQARQARGALIRAAKKYRNVPTRTLVTALGLRNPRLGDAPAASDAPDLLPRLGVAERTIRAAEAKIAALLDLRDSTIVDRHQAGVPVDVLAEQAGMDTGHVARIATAA